MKQKLFVTLLSFLAFTAIVQAEVLEPIHDSFSPNLQSYQKVDEAGLFLPMMTFMEDFKSVLSQIKDIRELVPKGTRETMKVMDLFNQINTSAICNSCQGLVSDFRKHSDPQKLEEVLIEFAEELCDHFENKTVCLGVVPEYAAIGLSAMYDKLLNPYNICEGFFMCPKTSFREHIKDYVKEVLNDKPATNIPTPTKKSTYTVMQVTDPHIDPLYEIGMNAFCNEPLCCRAANGIPSNASEAAQYWGTVSSCDLPERTFQQFLQFVANSFDVDMILWTGDNNPHNIWQQSMDNQTVTTYDATEDFIKYFPDTPIYPMFGNHEPYPCDNFDFSGNASDALKDKLSDMWKGWLDDEAYETFRNYSYYSMVHPQRNLKIIALNSIACDSDDFYLITNATDPDNQLQWLRQELYDAEANKQGVFIIGHIPPGSFGCDSRWSLRYRALIDRFTNIIRGQFFGHSHDDQFEVVRSYFDNSPVGAIYIAPSMTTFTNRYPSFRIFEIDSDTNTPVNYYQYRLDLDKWNQNTTGPIEWDLIYSFVEAYNLPDMSFKSYDHLADNIKSNTQVRDFYLENFNGNGILPTDITNRDIQHYYCSAKYSVSEDAFECLGLKATANDLAQIAQQLLPGSWHFTDC